MIAPSPSHVGMATLLLAAAVGDVRWRRVPNALSLALLLCGAAASVFDAAAPRFSSSAAAFGIVVVASTVAWRLRLCGGGDAKVAAAAATWAGLSRLPAFAFATAIAGGVLSASCYALSAASARRAIRANLLAASVLGPSSAIGNTAPSVVGRVSVPYGVAIAIGALYAVLGVSP